MILKNKLAPKFSKSAFYSASLRNRGTKHNQCLTDGK